MTRIFLGLGVAIAASLGGSPAQAGTTDGPVVVVAEPEPAATRRVSYADLDLTSAAGEKTLIRRIRTAVKQVCAVEVGPMSLFYVEYSCRKLTWRDTEPLVNSAISHARQMAGGGRSDIAASVIVVSAAH